MAQSPGGELALVAALSEFGLSAGDGWGVEHLRTLNNSVFSVHRSGDADPAWVLRVHRAGWRDAEAISAELSLLEYLDRQLTGPVSVPRPARCRSGDHLVSVDGSLYSLLSWAPGTPTRPDSGLDYEAAWLLGQGLGSIHAATNGWDHLLAPVRWDADTLFTGRHPGLMGSDPAGLQAVLEAPELELFGEIGDRTRRVFERLGDWGMIHGDYILGNCHWARIEGQLRLAVLDFDDFGQGPRLFDLGAVLGNLADFPDSWPVLGPGFLAGYRSVYDLPEEAERELPLMMAARHASQCLWVLGHRDLGQEWVSTHLRARMEMARDCLAATI